MANSKNNMDFHNAAGTYNYDTSARFGDYTNALNKDIIVNIISGANISVNNLNLNSSTLNVSSGNFEVRAATNLNEGTINVGSGGTFVADSLTNLNTSTININGGTVELKGNLANNNGFTVDFKNNPKGSLLIDGPNEEDDAEAIIIKNYTYGNTIKINYDNDLKDGESLTTTYDKDSKTLTVQDSDGKQIIKFENFTDVNGDNYPVVASAVTGVNGDVYLVIACFLAGSMVRTPQGDVAVEEIQIGDEVIAFDWRNNTDSVRPVVWVGKAHVNVRHGLPDDEAGWPVRILKDAIADGVPYKDMLITAEHCLFFKDRFVPVRMLVNGVSIFYDKSITSYDYYHVETEQHSVITADGMLTESYLDTGNRSSFRQEGKVVTLFGATKSWEDDAGAPLGVERSFVEPLFHALEWREDKVSAEQAPAAVELTSDPDLHLVTETGAVVRPMRKTANQYSFMLPPDTQSVRIVSRASRPSDVIGPFVDDRRYMGVAVADVRLVCAKKPFEITSHLQIEKPEGWHATDWADCAWTNGDAELPLGDHLVHGKMGILSITVRAAGPYIVDNQKATKSA